VTLLANEISNREELSRSFSQQGIIRIENFLQASTADVLSSCLSVDVTFENAFHLEGSNRQASDKDIAELPVESRRQLYQAIYDNAANGSGFLYGRNKITTESITPLKEALSLINNVTIIDAIKQITHQPNLTHADAQATRFRVGDFLTRHIDDVPNETRKIAYVLGLSPFWHPDWGGLLQFFENNGTPTKAWSPSYNSLTLFDVTKVHSVTSIAPFAKNNRYSITGWFRS
jgi:Rps23 Pro-64 3,4-dihydroxylase Tpa1-like proline 4-hydroxylase